MNVGRYTIIILFTWFVIFYIPTVVLIDYFHFKAWLISLIFAGLAQGVRYFLLFIYPNIKKYGLKKACLKIFSREI